MARALGIRSFLHSIRRRQEVNLLSAELEDTQTHLRILRLRIRSSHRLLRPLSQGVIYSWNRSYSCSPYEREPGTYIFRDGLFTFSRENHWALQEQEKRIQIQSLRDYCYRIHESPQGVPSHCFIAFQTNSWLLRDGLRSDYRLDDERRIRREHSLEYERRIQTLIMNGYELRGLLEACRGKTKHWDISYSIQSTYSACKISF